MLLYTLFITPKIVRFRIILRVLNFTSLLAKLPFLSVFFSLNQYLVHIFVITGELLNWHWKKGFFSYKRAFLDLYQLKCRGYTHGVWTELDVFIISNGQSKCIVYIKADNAVCHVQLCPHFFLISTGDKLFFNIFHWFDRRSTKLRKVCPTFKLRIFLVQIEMQRH